MKRLLIVLALLLLGIASIANAQQGPPEPDFEGAAEILGIPEEDIREAFGPLGQGPPNIRAVAEELGVTVTELTEALGIPAPPNGGGQGQPPQGNQDGDGQGQPPQGDQSGQQAPQGGDGQAPAPAQTEDAPGAEDAPAEPSDTTTDPNAPTFANTGTVTVGSADELGDFTATPECDTQDRFVPALTGLSFSDDGQQWLVPSDLTTTGEICLDVYNPCAGGENVDFRNQLTPLTIDEEGEVITAFLFGDNYFELYVNGTHVCNDAIGFVPFNSHAAQFQAEYPITYAVRLIDWETHLGLGLEFDEYRVGDGGFIASFSDGSGTSAEWKCQAYYTAPLDDASCVVEDENGNPDSTACASTPACASDDPESCQALHYELPDNWMMPDFDDSGWRGAFTYTSDQVTNQRAYQDYTDLFTGNDFIWSSNLDLDNTVICRVTIDAP